MWALDQEPGLALKDTQQPMGSFIGLRPTSYLTCLGAQALKQTNTSELQSFSSMRDFFLLWSTQYIFILTP